MFVLSFKYSHRQGTLQFGVMCCALCCRQVVKTDLPKYSEGNSFGIPAHNPPDNLVSEAANVVRACFIIDAVVLVSNCFL